MTAMEDARRWLADAGVSRIGDDLWLDDGERRTNEELAIEWAMGMLNDPDLDEPGRLRLGFGLLDLLGVYWVTHEIGIMVEHATDPRVHEELWHGYRARLEAPEPADAITYSLWVDWYEDHRTVATAFAQTLGDDVERLRNADEALTRRADRVLRISGPVPWALKEPVFEVAIEIPELHAALFRGLLAGYHDVFGAIEPEPALRLLARLPDDVEHFDRLCAVLRAGHRKHHLSPDAWAETADDGK